MVITILDYATGKLIVLDVTAIEDSIDNVEDYLESIGYVINHISYMVTSKFNMQFKSIEHQ